MNPKSKKGKTAAKTGRPLADSVRLKQTKKQLEIERSYLAQLFESAQEAIVMADCDHRILKVNSEFTRIFGYTKKEAQGKFIDELVSPRELAKETSKITRRVAAGKTMALEGLRRRKDGQLIYVSIMASPIVIGKKQVGVYGIYRDITRQKLAEKALATEKSYLSQLFESAQEGIMLGDNFGKIIKVNEEFTRIFGYTKKESRGRLIDDLIAPKESASEVIEVTRRASEGKTMILEGRRRRKDGSLIHASVLASPIIIDKEQVGVYAIYRDISKQKQAEAALQRAREELETRVQERTRDLNAKKNELEKHAAQASLLYKISQRVSSELKLDVLLSEIVSSIQETFNFYGVMLLLLDEKENCLSMKAIAGGYKDVFPSNLRLAVGEGMIGTAAATRQTQLSGDVTRDPNYVKKAKEITRAELSIPIVKGSRLIGVLDMQSATLDAFSESDITAMETLSTQIASALENAHLFDLAEKARAAAEAASQAKGMFLSRMSHEIRTPMNSVIGFSDMLLDTELNEEQVEFVRNITKSGEALLSLINEILDFSKIEAGQMSFQSIDFDLEVTAFDVCHITQPRLGNKPVEIFCRVGDNLPAFIKSDPTRIRQVLLNLISNAIKFTHEGEIDLFIDVEAENERQLKLHATVRDTGIGIPADKLETVFELFQQVDGSITRKYGGTGLGLAICKQIARLLKGEVWVESELGQGSTFHFTAWVDKSDKVFVRQPQVDLLAGKNALLVDDNTNNLNILSHVVQLVGMRSEAVRRGGDVLPALQKALAAKDPFDICILDIQMPDMSGYEVSKQLRAQKEPLFAGLKLLAFSSSVTKRIKMFKEAGFDGFLPKPIQRHTLITMLKRLLGEADVKIEPKAEKEVVITQHTLAEEAKHSVRILLAEDNPMNQKLAQYMLTKAGYQLEVANNGREAIEKYTVEPERFDLIFMDVHMPEMDGLEATRVLRNRGYQETPIIAMTADAMKEDREKCLQAGMNDYMAKPIKREEVFAMVKRWVFEE
ncbi:MAG: PAS domain S-box protein [Candidatus Aminicenantes bacterium]|nr:PAS domain S-box protein [Candidatus Aminicenantes bacterium]